jgi:2-succinyl-5-enolpyruvyl-6-hydroxy-3-cyclohexene-1-carboxylate synthase
MSLQPLYDIAEICAQQGITHAVICPGSRNAPLTLAFARHSAIKTFVIPDERSAGFIALGMAQQLRKPVVIISTSGTAAYNLAPAVTEAFFQQVPMLVVTADRPPEWTGQQDGQTIFQRNIFGNHVKQWFELPVSRQHPDEVWHINRIVNDAVLLTRTLPEGPVHINVPLREPFYPVHPNEELSFSHNTRIIRETPAEMSLAEATASELSHLLRAFRRVLLVAGQLPHNTHLNRALQQLPPEHVVLADVTANLADSGRTIAHADLIAGHTTEAWKAELQPDLLITFGRNILSKNLKLFLRSFPPKEHWHIEACGQVADVFQGLTRIIRTTPAQFCLWLAKQPLTESQNQFAKNWQTAAQLATTRIADFLNQSVLSELKLTDELLHCLPPYTHLHLANSMSVRYANMVRPLPRHVTVHSNRGTSGIDGCTSTAVGHALAHHGLHVLLTGDMAFFYDRNAFWHNYPLPNLRIAVLNNHGGTIFKMIDGPSKLPEADQYFVTQQALSAQHLCAEYGFEYIPVTTLPELQSGIQRLLAPGHTVKILELETRVSDNVSIFEAFKQHLRIAYATQIPLATH